MAKDKVKYTVTFSSKISNVIDEISELENISKPEVFRRALALYSYLRKEVESGKKIQTVGDDEIKEIVFQ